MIPRVYKTLFPHFESTEEPPRTTNNDGRDSASGSNLEDDLIIGLDAVGPESWSDDEDETENSDGKGNDNEVVDDQNIEPNAGRSRSSRSHKSKKRCRRPLKKTTQQQRHRTKEDEDIAVFLALAEKMSLSSLLFILQDHARQMHNIQQGQLQQVLSQHCHERPSSSSIHSRTSSSSSSSSASTMVADPCDEIPGSLVKTDTSKGKSKSKKIKKFRFAEIMGGQQVRVEVRHIPKVTCPEQKSELWWTDAEMIRIRQDALRVVRFYEQHRSDYSTSITLLAESYKEDTNDLLVEHHMKQLSSDSIARGLEPHLVQLLHISRIVAVQTVLLEQAQCQELKTLAAMAASSPRKRHLDPYKEEGNAEQQQLEQAMALPSLEMKYTSDRNQSTAPAACPNHSSHCSSPVTNMLALDDQDTARIREAYREASRPCRTLALRMAKWDHVEALKASLSSWTDAPKTNPIDVAKATPSSSTLSPSLTAAVSAS